MPKGLKRCLVIASAQSIAAESFVFVNNEFLLLDDYVVWSFCPYRLELDVPVVILPFTADT
jgi:hypothetical protein